MFGISPMNLRTSSQLQSLALMDRKHLDFRYDVCGKSNDRNHTLQLWYPLQLDPKEAWTWKIDCTVRAEFLNKETLHVPARGKAYNQAGRVAEDSQAGRHFSAPWKWCHSAPCLIFKSQTCPSTQRWSRLSPPPALPPWAPCQVGRWQSACRLSCRWSSRCRAHPPLAWVCCCSCWWCWDLLMARWSSPPRPRIHCCIVWVNKKNGLCTVHPN